MPRCGPNTIVSNCTDIETRSLSSKTNISLTEAYDNKNFPKKKVQLFLLMSRYYGQLLTQRKPCFFIKSHTRLERLYILSLPECQENYNGTQTHNHLVRKRQLKQINQTDWVIVYKLSGCRFESRCSRLENYFLYSHQRLQQFRNLEKIDSSFLNLNVKDKVSF